MKPNARALIFDTNVIDRCCDDKSFASLVFKHQNCGEYQFAISWVQIDELNSVRDQIGKLWRYRDLGMALFQLDFATLQIPLFHSKRNFAHSTESSQIYWQQKFIELYAVHPQEHDCLIALSAIAEGGQVITADKDFIKRIPKTTLAIDKFQERLVRHNSKCGGSFTNEYV